MKRCACGELLQVVLPNQIGVDKHSPMVSREESADYANSGSDFLAIQLGLDKPEHDVYLSGKLYRGKCRGR